MSHVSTGSKSYAASEICRYEEKFNVWAKEVPAVYRLHTKVPSAPVADMVDLSQRLPGWVFDKVSLIDPVCFGFEHLPKTQDSSEYKMFEKLYPREVRDLSIPSMELKHTTFDSSVSTDLVHAMPHIVHVVRRHIALRERQSSFNETDLRQPLDRLACHVWEPSEGDGTGIFHFRSECLLKLPRTDTFPISRAAVGSVSFILDSRSEYTLMKVLPATAEGMSCMVNSADSLALVHWVMEYKGEISKLEEVGRQVYYGMVSGLWQRRILGRMDDCVFGTAHAGSFVAVYAARWEKRPTGSLNRDGPSHPKSKSLAPVATRRTNPWSSRSKKTLTTDGGESNQDKVRPDSDLILAPIKEDYASDKESAKAMGGENGDYQIVVYQLKQYSTGNLLHMIQFYLLMRASRQLADEYRAGTFGDKWPMLLAEVETRSQFGWSPPPRCHGRNRSNLEDHDGDARWALKQLLLNRRQSGRMSGNVSGGALFGSMVLVPLRGSNQAK
ncbi:hypothetical protein FRC08_001303 [Ceratobasidium sp. 394]|nr:hypothetical protein FRC08_001303 [Ceratobasidium sp. 394]